MSDIFGPGSTTPPDETAPAAGVPPAVMRMLQDTTGVAPEAPQSGQFPVPPELVQAMTVHEPARTEIPVPPQWTEEHEKAAQREKMAWEKDSWVGKVKVTDQEKIDFLKAAIHDREVVLDVRIGPPAASTAVRVRTLSNRMMTALSSAMMEDRNDGLFGRGEEFDGGYWATRLQIVSMMLQVQSVDGTTVAWRDPEELDKMSCRDLTAALRAEASEWGEKLSAPRHALLTTAVSVFEQKIALCRSAMVNGDFSDPAD